MQIMEENKYLKKEIEKQKNAYLSDKRCTLLTSRFNNKTFQIGKRAILSRN